MVKNILRAAPGAGVEMDQASMRVAAFLPLVDAAQARAGPAGL